MASLSIGGTRDLPLRIPELPVVVVWWSSYNTSLLEGFQVRITSGLMLIRQRLDPLVI